MGIYDDERSGSYDNSFNRNFYKTTDRRGNNNSKQFTSNVVNETQKVDPKYSRETPFINEEKIEKDIDEIIDRIDKKNYKEKITMEIKRENEKIINEKDQTINELIEERNKLKQKKSTIVWIVLWTIVIVAFIIFPILLL
jgi:replication fork clamp-binding protein CrfC